MHTNEYTPGLKRTLVLVCKVHTLALLGFLVELEVVEHQHADDGKHNTVTQHEGNHAPLECLHVVVLDAVVAIDKVNTVDCVVALCESVALELVDHQGLEAV